MLDKTFKISFLILFLSSSNLSAEIEDEIIVEGRKLDSISDWKEDVSSTTLNSIHPLNRSIRYGAVVVGGQPWKQMSRRGLGGFGSIEYLTDTGTADLVANAGTGLSIVG